MIGLTLFGFLLGVCIGSFLNVVIFRYNTGMSVQGRSQCFSCSKTLSWYELIPLASFLIQRGKCRGCASKISYQYPAVELATGIIFGLIFYFYTPIDLSTTILAVYYLIIWSMLMVIVVYDLKHKIIPDGLVFTFAFLSLIKLFITFAPMGIVLSQPRILDLLAGPILALPFFLLWLVSEGKWMGFGDAKLALGIGWFLGLLYGASAIILAFWIGAVVGLVLIAFYRLRQSFVLHSRALSGDATHFIMKSEVPFAPFLIIGILIVFFAHIDVIGLSLII